MKNSMEQDQRITREFGRHRLAPPSPDLHDRVLRAAREALASRDAELHWTDRWLRACWSFREEILALASALMLILGVVMQLGGGQSVLADSIGRLSVTAKVSGSLYRVTSMDCTVLKLRAGDENSQYLVRWNKVGVARIDMNSSNDTEQTLWISKGTVSVADHDGGTVRSMAVMAMPSKWQPLMEFLTPMILAQHMERYGLRQAEHQEGVGPYEFLLVGQEDQQVIEIALDTRTYLPTSIKRYLSNSARTGRQRDYLEEVRFQWNKPIPQELFVPGSSEVKR